ncbi:MAG: tetratricopeptide repeat protein [Holophagales bacterium]|nr:MAG: tetratricopeptide repeat protein [Holophagales bacterium]
MASSSRRRSSRTTAPVPNPSPPASRPEPSFVRSLLTRRMAMALLPSLLALGVFATTLANGFVNDDEHQVLLNPWIRDLGSLPRILSRSVWGFLDAPVAADYYRPVMHLVLLAENLLFGLRAWGFHLVNVLFHAVNTGLVFLFVERLVLAEGGAATTPARKGDDAHWIVPFVAAAIFAVHPAQTEAVAWVASLPELTFTLAGLLALWLEIGARSRPDRTSTAALAAFGLALLAKETAVVVPVLLASWELTGTGTSWSALRAAGRRVRPYLALTGVYLAIRQAILAAANLRNLDDWHPTALEAVAGAGVLVRDYLSVLLLPDELDHWRRFRPADFQWSVEGGSVLFALGVVGAAVWVARRRRIARFGLALVALPLAPAFYVSLGRGAPPAERYLYLPMVGFALLGALALQAMASRPRLRLVAVPTLLLTVTLLAVLTLRRIPVWKDSYTLFVDAKARGSDVPLPPASLAATLLARGRPAEAVALLRILAEAEPARAASLSALGGALLVAGQGEEGIGLLRRALALAPEDAAGHFDLAGALSRSGRSSEALEHYRVAVRLRPDNPYFHAVAGIECAEQGHLDEAVSRFEDAVRLAPAEPSYRRNLERALALRAARSSAAR